MALGNQIALNNGPMNLDFDWKVISTDKGEVLKRINLRTSSIEGGSHTNEKIRGNTKISVELPTIEAVASDGEGDGIIVNLADGSNKTIGTIKNTEANSVLYFVYNSNSKHCVFEFAIASSTIEKVWFAESSLDFNDSEIKGFVAEGDVYFVNKGKMPKQFNIDRAKNYTNSTAGDSYDEIDKPFAYNVFPWIKRPPLFAPDVAYASVAEQDDVPINFNNIRGKLWQFKYNYRYKNNQESAYSSISKVPLPQDETTVDGEWVDLLENNNSINVLINTGGPEVKEVDVAVRDCSSRNVGSFFVFDTVEKYDSDGVQVLGDNEDYLVTFFNNKPLTSIDTEIGNRYFDNIPFTAEDCLLLDGKWAAMSRPEVGYDDVKVDYELGYEFQDAELDSNVVDMRVYNEFLPPSFVIYCGKSTIFTVRSTITIPSEFYPNSVYQVTVPRPGGDAIVIFVSTDAEASPGDIRDELYEQLKNNIELCDEPVIQIFKTGEQSIRINVAVGLVDDEPNDVYDIFRVSATITTTYYNTSEKGLKRGQYHPFAIIYNDEFGRYNVVYGDKDVYSPVYDGTEEDFLRVVRPKITINSKPPSWAKTYRIVYIPNKSYSYFIYVPAVEQVVGSEEGVPFGKSFLRINQALERIRNTFPHSQLADYEWQNGDRIRIPGSNSDFQITADYIREYTFNSETRVESGFIISGEFETISGTDDVVGLVEIYRPSLAPQDSIYYEISEDFEIIDAGTSSRRHAGNIYNQNQGYSTDDPDIPLYYSESAVSVLDFGDVYLRQRLSANADYSVAKIEDYSFSDNYDSTAIDIGRIAARIDTERKVLNRVVRGENYLENTNTNYLNVFLSGTKWFDVSDVYGPISGIEETGDVLKVFQEHKETSVYIGKVTAKEAEGSQLILLSDEVFGAYHRYVEFRGTTYRKSLIVDNRYVYYFDGTTGEFIRSATNGQIDLASKYNMQSWFSAKAKELRESTEPKDVIVSINKDYEEVMISFIIGENTENVVFSEKEGGKGFMYFWKSGSSPEYISSYGDTTFSFLKGNFWLHNEGEFNNFYGKQNSCSLQFICNADPVVEKRLSNIEIDSRQNVWDIEFYAPAGANYNEQRTVLTPAIIRSAGNRLVADILRNIISPSGVEDLNLLYNGHEMVGDAFRVELSNSDSSGVRLKDVIIKFIKQT